MGSGEIKKDPSKIAHSNRCPDADCRMEMYPKGADKEKMHRHIHSHMNMHMDEDREKRYAREAKGRIM